MHVPCRCPSRPVHGARRGATGSRSSHVLVVGNGLLFRSVHSGPALSVSACLWWARAHTSPACVPRRGIRGRGFLEITVCLRGLFRRAAAISPTGRVARGLPHALATLAPTHSGRGARSTGVGLDGHLPGGKVHREASNVCPVTAFGHFSN